VEDSSAPAAPKKRAGKKAGAAKQDKKDDASPKGILNFEYIYFQFFH
jgi:hypothetical protein